MINCRCATWNGTACFNQSQICDGIADCLDGVDEANCTTTCKEDEFLCAGGEKCIPESSVCDYTVDCPYGVDESNCECFPVLQTRCADSGECLWNFQLCDNITDCIDGSDEMDCDCEGFRFVEFLQEVN